MSKHQFLNQLSKRDLGAENQEVRDIHTLLSDLYDVLEGSEADKQRKIDALKIMSHYLEKNDVLSLKALHPDPKKWKQFYLGVYQFGIKVRVKPSAFSGNSNMVRYNGKEGIFNYTVNREVFITFNDDRLNKAPTFPPEILEAYV